MRKCLQIIVSGILLCFALSAYAAENPGGALQSESLLNIIRDMNRRYNVHFTYDREIVEKVKIKRRYNPESYQDVNEALSVVLRETNLKFQVLDKKYVVIYRDDQKGMESLQRMITVLQEIIDQKKTDPPQQRPTQKEGKVSRLENLPAPEFRIDRTVKGKVSDEKGEGLPGVSILVKGTQRGMITDSDGNFSIEVPDDDAVLVFSFVGYVSEEVVVGNRISIEVSMKVDEKGLEELVVVGYGTQKKRDLTGAISSVKAEELTLTSTPDVGRALKGKLAGLMVRENSAQPGGGIDILVRGAGSVNASNAPLIVVDGFPIADLQQPSSGGRYNAGTHSVLNSFNPNDIASVEVLKDASATAIYGARAANGVILITTKKGAQGKATLDYSASYTHQRHADTYDLLTAREQLITGNESTLENWMFNNNVTPYGPRSMAEAEADPVGGIAHRPLYTDEQIRQAGEGTDWLGLITRNGRIHQHNLSLSGGTERTQYFVSGNYYDHNGIIKNSGIRRFSIRTNLEQKIHSFMKVGLNLTASQTQHQNSQLGNDVSENSGIIRSAIQFNRFIQAIDENGNYPLDPVNARMSNPYSLLTIRDDGRVERILLNSFLEIKPIENLTFQIKASIDRGATKRWNYWPRTTLHGDADRGRASIASSDNNSYLTEFTGSYIKTFDSNHNINILAGASRQRFRNESESMLNTTFLSDEFLWYNIGSGTGFPVVASSGNENTFLSYFGRLNYSYQGKYLLTATLRTDGASVFSRNHKWGTFPSVAVGWNISDEKFFSAVGRYVSYLKLRVSHGQTGNSGIGSNASAAYRAATAYLSGTEQLLTGVRLSRLENPDLKWETTTETNLGIDFGFRNNRISGSFELYNKVISDLLNTHRLNSYHIINNIMANIGSTQSKGFELTVNTYNVSRKNFEWRSVLTMARFNDRWKSRAADWKPAIYENDNDPIRPIYSRISDGILQSGVGIPEAQPELRPGMVKLKDLDGFLRDDSGNPVVDENGRFIKTGKPDGLIDDGDTKLLGSTDPGLIVGFGNTFRYRDFTLSLDFNGMFGRQLIDQTYVDYGYFNQGTRGRLRTVLDRWTPSNPSTIHPGSFASRYGDGDFFLQNGWFMRLQNLSLSYNIPPAGFKGVISRAQVTVNANNLLLITPYTGLDPETDSYTAAYPNARSYSLQLNLSF